MAQVEDCLPNKHKALSSTNQPTNQPTHEKMLPRAGGVAKVIEHQLSNFKPRAQTPVLQETKNKTKKASQH
jgi:hypothetical protein